MPTNPIALGALDYAVAPGETLRDRLEEMNMSQSELARRAGLTPKHVSQVINGVATLSPDVADKLSYVTGIPVRLWLRLEADYRSAAHVLAAEDIATGEALDWAAEMPVGALVRAGVLPDAPSDARSRVQQLLSFFGVANLRAYRSVWTEPAAAWKQSDAYRVDPGAVAAWLRLGEIAADALTVAPYDGDGLRQWVETTMRTLSRRPVREGIVELVKIAASYGVMVVFVPEVTGARAFGATRWLTSRRPLVQLSIRGRSDVVLWETITHEFGHVLLHDRKATFIESDEPGEQVTDHTSEEQQARRFALSVLITAQEQKQLAELTTIEEVSRFAESIGVANSIAAARMHLLGLWSREFVARLSRQVSESDLPGAVRPARDERAARRGARRMPGDPR